MKRLLTLIALLLAAWQAQAQYYTIYTSNGNTYRVPCEELDRITTIDTSRTVKATPAEAVDLGLSVRWASHNVGATAPHEQGAYFAWGEVTEKVSYLKENYWLYDTETESMLPIGSDIRGTDHDAAHTYWGSGWRLPSQAEIKELVEKCTAEQTTLDGVAGYRITGPNGHSIFLPGQGMAVSTITYGYCYYPAYSWGGYWGDRCDEQQDAVSNFKLTSQGIRVETTKTIICFYGFHIRPVCP